MKKELTLVVMAAGMGSRFGGLKQIEPVGPSNEIIADYSVYDAIEAGFNKVIFIIRKENLQYFKENIVDRYQDKIKVEFAFQELDMIPSDVVIPESRVKMLGTGHAILCAKDLIKDDFLILNGDDFYGKDAFIKARDFFLNSKDNEHVTITYPMASVMSKNGVVKRGVCFKNDEGYLTDIIESEVYYENNKIIARPLANPNNTFEVEANKDTSMNLFGFKASLMPLLEEKFNEFIHGEITDKNEFLIPEVVKQLIEEKRIQVKCVQASSSWMGITYREDLDEVKENIRTLIKKGEYKESLWR